MLQTSLAALTLPFVPRVAKASSPSARIIVSLADNANQGIVSIPINLGNGQDPKNNLYWGALYGLRNYMKRQEGWHVRQKASDNPHILEKFSMYYEDSDADIIAEAWDGAQQRSAAESFMDALRYPRDDLTIFVGHNPLMDVNVPMPYIDQDRLAYNKARKRKFAVIACQSRSYFEERIKSAGHIPYVLTAGNMAPEAYVIEAILRAWHERAAPQTAREYAAQAYAKYQKIPLKNANWLFGV